MITVNIPMIDIPGPCLRLYVAILYSAYLAIMRRQLTIAIKRNEAWPESAVIAAVKSRLDKITQVLVRVRLYDGITMVYTF